MTRVVAVGLVALVVVAGCAGAGGGSQSTERPPLQATAAPATVDAETLAAAGYAERVADAPRLNTTVTATIQGDVTLQTTREVRATTARRVYARPTPDGPSVVALYSVPGVRPFENADLRQNPAADLSPAALANRDQPVYADVRGLDAASERPITLLGAEATLARYRAAATRDGGSESVGVALATVSHRGDYVSVVVVTPPGVDASLGRMLDGATHAKG